VNEFIQLESEVVEDQVEGDEDQVFQDLVDQYGARDEDIIEPEEDAAIDEEDRDIPVLEALQALETLRLFTLRREDGSESLLRELDQADRQFQAIAVTALVRHTSCHVLANHTGLRILRPAVVISSELHSFRAPFFLSLVFLSIHDISPGSSIVEFIRLVRSSH
jgi:hypothetical protein